MQIKNLGCHREGGGIAATDGGGDDGRLRPWEGGASAAGSGAPESPSGGRREGRGCLASTTAHMTLK
jgi:hypothetical protein